MNLTHKTIKTILVVDDEIKIVQVLTSYFEASGFNVLSAHSGKEALELFSKHTVHLVLLDLMLPDISGEDVCIKIRNSSKVPIIMLTAKVDEESILNGLHIGADDYQLKPFSPKQVVAKVEALLRRISIDMESTDDNVLLKCGALVVNTKNREVYLNASPINLTPNEFTLLTTLMRYPTKIFTRDELINHALGHDFDGFDRVIDTHIKNIRQKIELDPKKPHYIKTVFGIGYRIGGDSFEA